ncbi:DNA-binding protein [Bacillus phage vB_BanS-Thrax5]|nr:DNA-binding protein [Bacillus phage vB_BanS-Thrax5]
MKLLAKIINAYSEGSEIKFIAECFNLTEERVLEELRNFKEQSRYKRTFTDEFRIMVAERDMRKISRTKIAEELQLNVATVKTACEKFGNALKEVASNDNVYTVVEGVTSIDTCPNCGNKKVNEIETTFGNSVVDGIYCMECGDEHFIVHNYEEVRDKDTDVVNHKFINSDVYRINWEYLEE